TPLIYASSAATYGDGGSGFDDDPSLDALKQLRPMNLYGWSKHQFDMAVAERAARSERLPPQWAGLKFFNVFGPNEYHKGRMMSVLARRFHDVKAGRPVQLFKSHRAGVADGDQRRDFIYVDDVTRVMMWLLATPDVSGLFNVGTGTARSFRDLMLAAYAALGAKPNIQYIDMPEQIRGSYQYFTQSEVDRLRRSGYNGGFTALEDAVDAYVKGFLDRTDRFRWPCHRPRVQMFDFDALALAMTRQTVLCVGDLMLDEFVYGEVSRISPEAPAPVIAVQRSETDIGGAGNVARNIASLGARCLFVGLTGDDDAGKILRAELARESLIESVLVCDPARPTTRKVRFVAEHSSTHMLRADWELARPVSTGIEQQLIDAVLPLLPRADIVLLSDYAKGVLTARVIRNVIDAAKKVGKRVIVDPKSANLAIYRGATLLKPNRKEFAEATRSRAENIAEAAQEIMQLADCEAVLVTQGERGMTLVPRAGEVIQVPGHPVKVRDFSGAGDTVAAALALALAAGADWETALRIANAAAAVAVGKKGTAVVTPTELRRKILPHASLAAEEKIVAAGGDLDIHLVDWRKQGLRVG